jgi:hypothetical protein
MGFVPRSLSMSRGVLNLVEDYKSDLDKVKKRP